MLPQRTKQAFNWFGLDPQLEIRVPLDWDTLLENGAAVLFATLLPTLIYFLVLTDRFPDSDMLPGSTLHALAWTITAVLAHGMAIIAALFVFRFTTRQPKYVSRANRVFKPSAARTFIVGYAVGLLTFVAYAELDAKGQMKIQEISIWALLPATTAAFIGYHLDHYVYENNPGYSRVKGALLQGMVTMLVSVLIVALLYSRYMGKPELPYFLTFVALVAGLIGAGIGYTFPEGYKRNLRGSANNRRWRSARLSFKSAPLPMRLAFDGEEYPARLLDISTIGAAFESSTVPDANAAVEVDLPDVGKVKGMLARQDKGRCFLKFFPDQPVIDQVRSYIATRVISSDMQIPV